MGRPPGSATKPKGVEGMSLWPPCCLKSADRFAARSVIKIPKSVNSSARRQSLRSRKSIPNTSDMEDNDESGEESIDELERASSKGFNARACKANSFTTPSSSKVVVAVPLKRSATSSRSVARGLSSASASSHSDRSSPREQSLDYETPGTSAVVTPAESIVKAPTNLRQNTKGKRKREIVDMVKDDEDLAKALQAEEYSEISSQGKSKTTRALVNDSDDDLSELSDVITSDAEADAGPSRKKIALSNGRSTRPPRSVRTTARKTLLDRSMLDDLGDDDDDVEESEFSEQGSDALLDSDDEEDDDIGAPVANPSNDTISASTGNAQDMTRRNHVRLDNVRRRRGNFRGNNTRENRMAKERLKLECAHPEIKTMWSDLANVPRIIPEQAGQPKAITRKLKSFQLEGLDWMMRQEQSKWKGGLLGDEMGMGKTIQAVSLIMSDWPCKEPTLVVVPPVALMQWQNEIREYTDGKLQVLIYHNTNPKVKQMKVKDLKQYDVIMISYSGLESIYRKESKGWKRDDGLVKENSKIHAIEYHRIILDEAHNIKTRTTGVAKACFALKSHHKWCLSGTPVQNRIGEFFSLLRFLQIDPFACYFCKSCKCSKLHWSQNDEKKCSDCGHTGFQHVSIFNQELLNPITQQGDNNLRKEAFRKLRLVTDRIMLRRMKRDHTSSMELPPKEVIIHNEFFGEIERDFSSSIMSNTTRQFDTYVSRGVMLNNYANIFGLIMQMRQVANHPDLILKKHAEGGQNVLVCCICDETAEEPIRSKCHHEFCRKCAKDYVRSFDEATPDCPRCHIPLAIDFEQPDIEQDEDHVKKNSIINRIKMEDWTSSTKIEMLVYDLYKLRSAKQTHKSIVFSQFTSMLQLVEWRLRRAGFKTVMLDGSMSPSQRQKSIEFFMNNTDVEVFLVSLKAGGVALNLTEASRVFIIDPYVPSPLLLYYH